MATCELYEKGFTIRRGGLHFRKKSGGGKRGKLSGKYSAASFRRLREFVVTHTASGECWGITLTVPGLDNLYPDEFRVLQHRFTNWANKWRIPLVWRVELQRRGMPHLHCVIFGSVSICLRCAVQWFRVLQKSEVWSIEQVGENESDMTLIPRAFVRGSSHAFNLVRLDGGFSAFRYLVAHMSKGKQEQLGYAGRNWGVVYRAGFSSVKSEVWVLDECQYFDVLRWVRRWTRRKVYARIGCSCWVSNPAILRRMCEKVVEREPRPGGAESAARLRGSRALWLYSWFGLQWVQMRFDFLGCDLVFADTLYGCEKLLQEIMFFICCYVLPERIPF